MTLYKCTCKNWGNGLSSTVGFCPDCKEPLIPHIEPTALIMKPGDWVRHKLTNETFSVKKVVDSIVVLNRQQPFEISKFRDEIKIAICQIKNLEIITKNN